MMVDKPTKTLPRLFLIVFLFLGNPSLCGSSASLEKDHAMAAVQFRWAKLCDSYHRIASESYRSDSNH